MCWHAYRSIRLCSLALAAVAVTLLTQRSDMVLAQADEERITLEIEFTDRAESKQFSDIRWREKMTVLDVMNVAKKRTPGIQFTYRGSGRTALLIEIDGVKSEGAKGNNWIYRVNGKLGDRSFAIRQLKPGDQVHWQLGTYP